MACVPVTLMVMIYPKNKTTPPYPATLVGYAWATGLEPGHPLPPEGEKPPGDTSPPYPAHPIVLPGTPEHPIVLPPENPIPPELPSDPGMVKPPPPDGGWGWSPVYGWGYFPGTGGAGPKK